MKTNKILLFVALLLVLSLSLFGCVDLVLEVDKSNSVFSRGYIVSASPDVIDYLHDDFMDLNPSPVTYGGEHRDSYFSIPFSKDAVANINFAAWKKHGKYYYTLLLDKVLDLSDEDARDALTESYTDTKKRGLAIWPKHLGKVSKLEVYINKRKFAEFNNVNLSTTYAIIPWNKIYSYYDVEGRAVVTYIVTK